MQTTPTSRFEAAPLTRAGTRIKACFHCHSTESDGGLSPRDTAEKYRGLGYQCLGISDHRIVTPTGSLARDGFLTIPTTENGGQPDILGVGVREAIAQDLTLAERASRLAAQGGFTIAAHPTYCAVLPEAYTACEDLMALEIYNAYCDSAYANGYAVELWDMVLGLGKRVWGVAGDDAHLNPRKRHYSDAGLGWVEIWAASLSQEHVLVALKQGAFFATQGPVFEEIIVAENTIRIACSPVAQIRWRTFGKAGYVQQADGQTPFTRSQLPETLRLRTFVRIELVDEHGKRAWSNPFFVNTAESPSKKGA